MSKAVYNIKTELKYTKSVTIVKEYKVGSRLHSIRLNYYFECFKHTFVDELGLVVREVVIKAAVTEVNVNGVRVDLKQDHFSIAEPPNITAMFNKEMLERIDTKVTTFIFSNMKMFGHTSTVQTFDDSKEAFEKLIRVIVGRLEDSSLEELGVCIR